MRLDIGELREKGWTTVDGVSCPAELLAVGRILGQPAPCPNGEMIKEIRVTPSSKAPPGSQSALYGTGPFPFHTDTVFWPVPVRYVVLRASGDTRRPTTTLSFARLIHECGAGFQALAERSVWLVGGASEKLKKFYCSLRFQVGPLQGWRYDADCMTPANAAAVKASSILRPLVSSQRGDGINWCSNIAVVLSNWHVLHGRGPQPEAEGVRVIQRLYVT